VKDLSLAGLVVLAVLVVEPPIAAVIEQPTDRDIGNALNLANSGDAQRAHFHAPYIVPFKDDTIEQLEVITEFRRYVLAAEEELKGGNWMLGRGGYDQKGRSLKEILRPFAGQVSIRAQLRFHPHNSFVALPAFDILLGQPTLLPVQSIRSPHVTRLAGDGIARDFISGATIETTFNAPSIEDRVLPIRIISEGKELVRTTVDFSRLE
jgi:hypothetical protein